MSKIIMKNAIAELDGDEMTRILWKVIKDKLLEPFIELKTEYFDLGLKERDDSNDAITYEVIPYEFTIDIEENLGNSLKSLDLIEFLWHYIVLEIPLRYTVSDETIIETNDYRVISEEEYNNKNNPFKDFYLE